MRITRGSELAERRESYHLREPRGVLFAVAQTRHIRRLPLAEHRDHDLLSEVVEFDPSTRYTQLDKYAGTLEYDACALLRFENGMVGRLPYSGSVTLSVSTRTTHAWLPSSSSNSNVKMPASCPSVKRIEYA